MTWYENIPKVTYNLIDGEGTIAGFDLYFALESDLDSLWLAVQQESRFLGITACALYSRMLTIGAAQIGAPEPTGSNLDYGILVLRSASETYTTIKIPGIKAALLSEVGCFAGVAIDILHPDIAALGSAAIVAPLVTERGDPVIEISSGGAIKLWSDLTRRSG